MYVFDNVVDMDFSSMYPHIIITFNVAPNTMIGKLDFADNEFTAKLMARHDTKVNLDVTESIDGDNIGGLAVS